MILPFGRPPLNNLSNPGIPVGVLRLPFFSGLAEDAAISDSQIKAGRDHYHNHADTAIDDRQDTTPE